VRRIAVHGRQPALYEFRAVLQRNVQRERRVRTAESGVPDPGQSMLGQRRLLLQALRERRLLDGLVLRAER
jgi:hypothetical protein